MGETRPPAVVDSVRATAYTVPTDQPEADGTATWGATTMVVVEARGGGHTGLGWTYGPSACAGLVEHLLAGLVVGRDVMAVPGSWEAMVRGARNATRAGAVGYAISAVDVALWDLKARLLELPLVDLFGRVHDSVDVYGSGGFTTYDDDRLTGQLTGWTDQGMGAVKIKIGQDWGGDLRRDVARMRRAREIVGDQVRLFVDANGAYTTKQAVRVWRSVADLGIVWFEEPVSSDDLAGLREVRGLVDADVTAGEYGTGITYFRRMCAAEAVDCLQVDATRAGGYTEWLRSAAVAASHGLDVSAHCAPNLHAPVAAATPNLRHLEWFHDHVRVEQLLLTGTASGNGGSIPVGGSGPGHGYALDTDRARPYEVSR